MSATRRRRRTVSPRPAHRAGPYLHPSLSLLAPPMATGDWLSPRASGARRRTDQLVGFRGGQPRGTKPVSQGSDLEPLATIHPIVGNRTTRRALSSVGAMALLRPASDDVQARRPTS